MSEELHISSVEDVRDEVARIEAMKGDQEAAHVAEDDLLIATLRAIAEGAPDAAALAREALKVEDIDYLRWYS